MACNNDRLHEAVVNENINLVKSFLKAGANANLKCSGREDTLLHIATTVEIIEVLIAYGADVNAKDIFFKSPLYYAVTGNKGMLVIIALLQAGADVNIIVDKEENTLLHYATTGEIVKELLRYGANIDTMNKLGDTPLFHAVIHRKGLDVIKTLLSEGACITRYHNAPALHYTSDLAVINEMIKHGVDINEKDSAGRTVLHYAIVAEKEPELVLELLKHGANVNQRDIPGYTPLYLAICDTPFNVEKRLEIIKQLLEYGADVNIGCQKFPGSNHSCLMLAMDSSTIIASKLLIKLSVLYHYEEGHKKAVSLDRFSHKPYYPAMVYLVNESVEEVAKMKNDYVNSSTSVYDFITKNRGLIKPMYGVAEGIDKRITEDYPVYHDIILSKLLPSVRRVELLDTFISCQPFCVIEKNNGSCETKEVILNSDCLYKISEYLCNDDLSNFLTNANPCPSD